MARLPRLAVPGHPHHLIQRGNNRQAIFADAQDCERFLAELGDLLKVHGVALHAYVLMPNHVHLLATPASKDSLSKLMQALGRRYVGWFNRRHQRTGGLFEGRFRTSVIEADRYLLACSRYIELNPVRAGLVPTAEGYRWSSLAHYLGLRIDPLITEHPLVWSLGNTPYERQAAYRALFDAGLSGEVTEQIRFAVHHGWGLGTPAFLQACSAAVPRRLAPRRAGRPPTDSVPNNKSEKITELKLGSDPD
jgi:putative transposase